MENQKKKYTYYNCYSAQLFSFLVQKGFLPYEQFKHKENGNMVWRFAISMKFEEALKEYSQTRKVRHF